MEAETTAAVGGEVLPSAGEPEPDELAPSGPEGDEEGDEGGESAFLAALTHCGSCGEAVSATRQPKLLGCLHTLCMQCVELLDVSEVGGQIACPKCRHVSHRAALIDNLFLPAATPSSAPNRLAGSIGGEEEKVCTGCEESVAAMFYCVDCCEYLCDQCTQAHRRVKVTKDHTVEPKDSARPKDPSAGSGGAPGAPGRAPQLLMCPLHPLEQLRLYCDTCCRLTCRDCQLSEHKDHKYKFLQEAATVYKEHLQVLLGKIKEKQAYISNAKSLIDRRKREIANKEREVGREIKTTALAFVADINRKAASLSGELHAICAAKRAQLERRDGEIDALSTGLEHGLAFAEWLLAREDDTGLLHLRRVMSDQLGGVLAARCEVPNPHHVVDLRFAANPMLSAVAAKMGCVVVDGVPFRRSVAAGGLAAPVAPPGSLGVPIGTVTAVSGSQHQRSGSGGACLSPGGFEGAKHATFGSMSSSQKALLLSSFKNFQQQQQRVAGGAADQHRDPAAQQQQQRTMSEQLRQHMLQQQRALAAAAASASSAAQQHSYQQQQQQASGRHGGDPGSMGRSDQGGSSSMGRVDPGIAIGGREYVSNAMGRDPIHGGPHGGGNGTPVGGAYGSHRLSHLPNQSANISSTNHGFRKGGGNVATAGIYYPPYGVSGGSAVGGGRSAYRAEDNLSPSGRLSAQGHQQQAAGIGSGQINLAQLQEERARRRELQQVTTSLQPIVIQPTGYEPPSPRAGPPYMLDAGASCQSPLTDCADFKLFNSMSSSKSGSYSSSRHAGVNDPTGSYGQTASDSKFRTDGKFNPGGYAPLYAPSTVKLEAKSEGYEFLDLTTSATSATSRSTWTPTAESPLTPAEPTGSGRTSGIASLGGDALSTDELGGGLLGDGEEFGGDASLQLVESHASGRSLTSGWVNEVTSPLMGREDEEGGEGSGAMNTPPALSSMSHGDLLSTPETPARGLRSADDPSDDYCAVCNNGGELLCCDGCPKVFHYHCHVMPLSEAPSGPWMCGLCQSESDIRLDTPVSRDTGVNPASGSMTKRRSAAATPGLTPREFRRELCYCVKVCERLLLELFCHADSPPFQVPVLKSVPNYYKIIQTPMDLGTIRSKLAKVHFNHYQALEDFLADVRLVFFNCAAFNQPESDIGRAGCTLENYFERRVRSLLPYLDLRSITPLSEGYSDLSTRSKRRRVDNRARGGRNISGAAREEGGGRVSAPMAMEGARNGGGDIISGSAGVSGLEKSTAQDLADGLEKRGGLFDDAMDIEEGEDIILGVSMVPGLGSAPDPSEGESNMSGGGLEAGEEHAADVANGNGELNNFVLD